MYDIVVEPNEVNNECYINIMFKFKVVIMLVLHIFVNSKLTSNKTNY